MAFFPGIISGIGRLRLHTRWATGRSAAAILAAAARVRQRAGPRAGKIFDGPACQQNPLNLQAAGVSDAAAGASPVHSPLPDGRSGTSFALAS